MLFLQLLLTACHATPQCPHRSGVFGALVALLRTPNPRIYEMATSASSLEAARAENLLRWNDMVVKCLIKMTKQLSTIIPVSLCPILWARVAAAKRV